MRYILELTFYNFARDRFSRSFAALSHRLHVAFCGRGLRLPQTIHSPAARARSRNAVIFSALVTERGARR